MVKGLNEITELISKGTINRKAKGKSVDAFQDPEIIKYMTKVRDIVGRLVAIVNKSRADADFVDIPWDQREKIDLYKLEIIRLSNAIAASKEIPLTIASIGGWE